MYSASRTEEKSISAYVHPRALESMRNLRYGAGIKRSCNADAVSNIFFNASSRVLYEEHAEALDGLIFSVDVFGSGKDYGYLEEKHVI